MAPKTTLQGGRLIILSGPSGVGKTTVVQKLLSEVPGLVRSVSATTRSIRPGEKEGVDYFFLSREAFDRKAEAGEFLEIAEVFGHAYGTPRAFVEATISKGKSVLLAIDVQGADQVRSRFSPVVSFFLAPPSLAALRERLAHRKTDSGEEVERRLAIARQEIARKDQYDYVVVNDDLAQTVAQIRALLETILHKDRSSLLP